MYAKLKNLQSQTMSTRLGIIELKKQMNKEAQHKAQCREQQINQFGECLQHQQLLFNEFASSLLASIPHNELRLNAPTFFHKNTGNHNMDEGLHPLILDEFRVKALKQIHLFYSQGTAQKAVYKESRRRFYDTRSL